MVHSAPLKIYTLLHVFPRRYARLARCQRSKVSTESVSHVPSTEGQPSITHACGYVYVSFFWTARFPVLPVLYPHKLFQRLRDLILVFFRQFLNRELQLIPLRLVCDEFKNSNQVVTLSIWSFVRPVCNLSNLFGSLQSFDLPHVPHHQPPMLFLLFLTIIGRNSL